jgi:hypothetical protein
MRLAETINAKSGQHAHLVWADLALPAWELRDLIGSLDDVVAVVLLLRYAARAIPRDVLLAAWPAEPRLLERLLPTVP